MAPKANTNWLWNKSKVYVNEAKSDDEQCLLSDERKSKDELDALRTSYRRLKTILIGAFFVLTTICLALLISNLTDWRLASDQPRKASPIPPSAYLQVFEILRLIHDYSRCAVSSTSITFALDRRFAGPSSIENDQAWNALIPVSASYTAVSERILSSISVVMDSFGSKILGRMVFLRGSQHHRETSFTTYPCSTRSIV